MFKTCIVLLNTAFGASNISQLRYSSFRAFSQNCISFNKKIDADQKHLKQFQQQLRSEVGPNSYTEGQTKEAQKHGETQQEVDKKSLHTKFYREEGKPFLKVVAMTFATFYSLRILWAYLESTEETKEETS